uniref:histidine kinase n=1 Tax=Candidatus Kentrum sp. UNK TaxID=2126344 RepID=A0A451A4P3_9GAMM|nr:MAG: Signal transduction histidine kinase [Candidatus Kentron sp. UNK]VFK69588.1 MAG: Signal transduction histidine kinase [Candidatus Kentron sp. UNK]
MKDTDTVTLTSYATALANAGQNERAFGLFERSLALKDTDTVTLNSYATALANAGENERAFALFERSLDVTPDNKITLLQFGLFLETQGRYEEAIGYLESIPLSESDRRQAGFVCLNLGRLYYRDNQRRQAEEWFKRAVAYSDDAIASKLNAARHILVSNPYSKEAVALLAEIIQEMPDHGPARQMLRLNLGLKEQYERFGADDPAEYQERELLNRAIYHKIANEIGLFKGLVHRLAKRSESQSLAGLIEQIEFINEEIGKRRNAIRAEEGMTPADPGYEQVLETISATAQDISDFVNNEIAILERRVRRLLKGDGDSAPKDEFQRLLEQIEFTQGALDDLETVNEAIRPRMEAFPVRNLFDNWAQNPEIDDAATAVRVTVKLDNPDAIFSGDQQKIKAILKELVGNAIRHNPGQKLVRILLMARDVENLSDYVLPGKRIPGQRKYLNIIYMDDGKGIPEDKKEWVFQPLKTTAREGGGLGLFILRKTVRAMRGYILERGRPEGGARFEIYLPYGAEK